MKARMMPIFTILSLSLLLGAAGAAASAASAAEEAPKRADLFIPGSYEQYLALKNPADIALNDSHIVIADANKLYIYDKARQTYTSYSHTAQNGDESTITRLQFTDDGRLYFSNQISELYYYDFETGSATIQNNVSCADFVIVGDTLYKASVAGDTTTFQAIPCSDISPQRAVLVGDHTEATNITPHMFVKDDSLYCVVEANYYCFTKRYTEQGSVYEASDDGTLGDVPVNGLTAITIFDGEIYYATSAGTERDGLYRTDLTNAECVLGGTGIRALTVCNGHLYCVQGNSVRELGIAEDGTCYYTGYEIAASSNSVNRISGARETVRVKDLVVTADCGNERTSVYDRAADRFTVLGSGAPDYVATDGELVAAAIPDGERSLIKLYDFAAGGTEPFYTHETETKVTGLACVFGKVYYTTSHAFGLAQQGAREIQRDGFSPTALANNVFGDLYVADQLRNVTRFPEEEFLDPAAAGETVNGSEWKLPAREDTSPGFSSLRSDFCGNLYYLSGNSLFRNGKLLTTFDATDAVYYGDAAQSAPVSYALGYEDDTIYVQYGNFALKVRADFPTLSTIAADGVREDVFSTPGKDSLTFTAVTPASTGICVDLSQLSETSSTFAFERYERTEKGGRGICLSRKGDYLLLALFENYDYTVALFRAQDCEDVPVSWTDISPVARYTTNEIAFTHFPCLAQAVTIRRLPRAEEVTMLAGISVGSGEGFDYAYVRCGAEYGYLPLAYLTESAPVAPEADRYTLGYLKANDDGVTFHSAAGDLSVIERVQVKIYDLNNGLYRVTFEKNGVEYTAQVTENMLQRGNANAIRTSLIIILCVLAVGIVAAYVLLLPRKKKWRE